MTKVVVDASLDAKLAGLREPAELCDQSGRILGFFHPVARSADAEVARDLSPFSDEEVERRRQQRSGSRLEEIVDRLTPQ